MNASKQLRRLRVPNANNADTNNQPNGRILQGSMSMATTESISDIEHKEVIDTIVSKLEASGVPVDPAMMLAALTAVEDEESSPMHYGEYDFTEKCVWFLFHILPDYKASKLSPFLCGERVVTTTTVTSSGILSLSASHEGGTRGLKQHRIGRRLQTPFNNWSPGAIQAFEDTIQEAAQADLVPPTSVGDVTVTGITVNASGDQEVSFGITLVNVDCGGCSPAEISQAASNALASAASSLATSLSSGAFATTFQDKLTASGTTDCGNPPTCTGLVESSGANNASSSGLGSVSYLRLVYIEYKIQ